jgi:phosphate transport system substrate-binding protein
MKRMASVVAGLMILVAGFTTSCGRSGTGVTVAGSTAFQPFAEKLAESYMAAHPGSAITVQGGGSAVGIQSALSGAAQIGMADLVELPPEANKLNRFIVARDGISIVVHPANRVANLSLEQIRGIFNGTLKNWKDLGGADSPITVVSREAGSGTRSSFEKIAGGILLTSDAIIQDSNGTIRETVANDSRAVGYLSHGVVNEKVRQVPVEGSDCTSENVLAGRYLLVRPVYMLTKDKPGEVAEGFISYILSEEGQRSIEEDGLLRAK